MVYLSKKTHNNLPKNFSFKKCILRYGYYGIKSCEFNRLTSKKISILKRFLDKQLQFNFSSKKIKIWNRISLNLNLTKLSLESRMGKGKGNIYESFSYIKPGQILFEISKFNNQNLNNFFVKIQKQIGFKIKIVKRSY